MKKFGKMRIAAAIALVAALLGSATASAVGGGDKLLFEDFVSYITGGAPTETRTTLADSLISHRMSFAAEESRLAGGEPIDIR